MFPCKSVSKVEPEVEPAERAEGSLRGGRGRGNGALPLAGHLVHLAPPPRREAVGPGEGSGAPAVWTGPAGGAARGARCTCKQRSGQSVHPYDTIEEGIMFF